MATLAAQLKPYQKLATDLGSGRFATAAFRPVGAELRQIAIGNFRSEVGAGGLRLGRNNRYYRAGARYIIKGDNMRVQMTPPSIWGLAENGAEPHVIRTRGRGRKVMPIGPPGRMTRSPVNHPGMAPLGSPIKRTVAEVPKVWMTEQTVLVGKYL